MRDRSPARNFLVGVVKRPPILVVGVCLKRVPCEVLAGVAEE